MFNLVQELVLQDAMHWAVPTDSIQLRRLKSKNNYNLLVAVATFVTWPQLNTHMLRFVSMSFVLGWVTI